MGEVIIRRTMETRQINVPQSDTSHLSWLATWHRHSRDSYNGLYTHVVVVPVVTFPKLIVYCQLSILLLL